MSYQISFKGFNTPSITVSDDRGKKVKDLWFGGQKNTPIDIDGNAYLVGDIKRIEHVADPQPSRLALPEPDKCKGQFSIQREINNLIKDQYPKDWAKRIQSTKFREEIRKKLREQPGVLWCDYKANECVCDKEKPADPSAMDNVRKVFGAASV